MCAKCDKTLNDLGIDPVLVEPITTAADKRHNGLIRCWCGCKYWSNGKCFDCGEPVERAKRHQDEILGVLS